MTYLLDVNVLVAFGVVHHEFHQRVRSWVRSQPESTIFVSVSITELGFIRILSQATTYGFTVAEARSQLLRNKKELSLTLLSDGHDASHLPTWVKSSQQITDGHLLALAKAFGALLATFDKGIPGAFLIPYA